MSVQAPDDTEKVLERLILSSEKVLSRLSLMDRLLLKGAIIDAKSLLAEIKGEQPSDTHTEALLAIGEEMRKAREHE